MTDPVLASDSILNTVKRSLDIATDDDSFDTSILTHINSVFSDLYQLGLGAYGSEEYQITGSNELWTTALGNLQNLAMIKSYVTLRIRLLFDPPQAGFTTNSYQSQIDKMEWRISVAASSSPNSALQVDPVLPAPAVGSPSIWNLTGLADFPPEAPVGAMGVDMITGIIWRKDA